MGPIEYALREDFFHALFGGEEVSADLREIIGYSMKHSGLCIPDPQIPEERAYNTYKAASEVLVGSLLGGTNLNYIAHKGCVCRASADGQKQREFSEIKLLTRQKDMAYRAGLNRLQQAT